MPIDTNEKKECWATCRDLAKTDPIGLIEVFIDSYRGLGDTDENAGIDTVQAAIGVVKERLSGLAGERDRLRAALEKIGDVKGGDEYGQGAVAWEKCQQIAFDALSATPAPQPKTGECARLREALEYVGERLCESSFHEPGCCGGPMAHRRPFRDGMNGIGWEGLKPEDFCGCETGVVSCEIRKALTDSPEPPPDMVLVDKLERLRKTGQAVVAVKTKEPGQYFVILSGPLRAAIKVMKEKP